MEDDFFLVEIILGEKKEFFYNDHGPSWFQGRMLFEELVWKDEGNVTHGVRTIITDQCLVEGIWKS
jgi:hypothetical protein